MRRIFALGLAFAVLVAAKPVPVAPSMEMDADSETAYLGEVWFDVTDIPARTELLIDIQCYGSIAGGTNNVGWWDTGPISKVFVLGSESTTAPPDLGNVIYLEWTGQTSMECTARLFKSTKKGVTVYDSVAFPA